MPEVRFGLVLDSPKQHVNKGSNVLYLGEFEFCNAGDRSARIYIGDSNGDIVEIEDDVEEYLGVAKQKLINVAEVMPADNYKPKILYMIRNGDDNKSTYNGTTIKKMYQYFKENQSKLKPFMYEPQVLGITHKVLPFMTEKNVFGVIEGTDIKDLTGLLVDLTNMILNDSNKSVAILQNLIHKIVTELPIIYAQMGNALRFNSNSMVSTIGYLLKKEELENRLNNINDNLAEPMKLFFIDHFAGATGGRYSAIYISADNGNRNDYLIRDPFADVLIVQLSGSSIQRTCSFRLDKRTNFISDMYCDFSNFYPTQRENGFVLPIMVKNGYRYAVGINWKHCRVEGTTKADIIPLRFGAGPINILDTESINDLLILDANNNSTPYRIEMDQDDQGGRVLRTLNAITNEEVSSIRTDNISISSGNRYLSITSPTGIVGNFRMITNKMRPGPQFNIQDLSNNTVYYLEHYERRTVIPAVKKYICSSYLSGRHSSPAYGNFTGICDTGCGTYEGYIEVICEYYQNGGDFDSHGFELWVYNANDHSRNVYKKMFYDYGSNYSFTMYTYRIVLTQAEVEKLGGKNTRIAIQGRIYYDSGRGGSVCEARYYVTIR